MTKIQTVTCEWCGAPFPAKQSSWRRACSKKCRNQLTQREERAQPSCLEIERQMEAMVAREIAMPWDRPLQ